MSDDLERTDAGGTEATPGGAAAEQPTAPRAGGRQVACLTALPPVTTPGCAGCLTAVFLVTTVVTVWTAFWLDPDNVPWRHSMSAWRIGFVLLMVLVIPLVVRRTVQEWLETESAKFPDVDYAWQAGLQALAANGISLASTPVFVVLGASGEKQERALLDDGGLKLRVEGVPEGPAPLHGYASKDAIYLCCSDASWTGALAALREELVADARAKGIAVPESPTVVPRVTADVVRSVAPPPPPMPAPAAPPAAPPPPAAPQRPASVAAATTSGVIGGTMMLDAAMLGELTGRSSAAAAPSAPPPAETPMAASTTSSFVGEAPPAAVEQASYRATFDRDDLTAPAGLEPVLVAPQYSAACLKQLQYVGGLLRRARSPVCPMNGVLSLIPFEAIHGTTAEVDELRQALRGDLATLQYATQLRAPTTALIVGMEKERGFRELVRRVGKDRALTQRFGRKFDVRAYPTREQLASLAAHVCGAFEDWTYALFREENALSRPGNTRLYELLSKVRCGWKERMADLLADGFGCEPTKSGRQDSLLFSGCYFAATGDTPDRRAFARGVIDKLHDEQEFLEWSRESAASSRRQSTFAALGMLATVFLLVTLAIMFLLGRLR